MNKLLILGTAALVTVAGCSKSAKTPVTSTDPTALPPSPSVDTRTAYAPIPGNQGTAVNTAGPTENISVDPTLAAGRKYTVKKGDTLWSIAQRTYGDGKKYKTIAAANPAVIKGDRVNAGQTITLP